LSRSDRGILRFRSVFRHKSGKKAPISSDPDSESAEKSPNSPGISSEMAGFPRISAETEAEKRGKSLILGVLWPKKHRKIDFLTL
jgi:hypothetical protein